MGPVFLIYDQNATNAEEYAATQAIKAAEGPAHLVIDREATMPTTEGKLAVTGVLLQACGESSI